LVGLGAPSALVERCYVAALDEVDHANRAFGLASAYAGYPIKAGPLPALLQPRASASRSGVVRLAVGSLIDGCLAEGESALMARLAAEPVEDPALRETLLKIAEDEARHAEIGWSVLEWCVEEERTEVTRALEHELPRLHQATTTRIPLPVGLSGEKLARFGYLPRAKMDEAHTQSVREVQARAQGLLSAQSRRAA
jgi:hypothetical protein